MEYAAFFVHMFFKKTSSFFHEISISFSYSSSILRNVLRRNKREPNELQTSSFFTSFISLKRSAPVDSRALLPHSVYAGAENRKQFVSSDITPIFYPTVLCRVLRARRAADQKRSPLRNDFLRCAKVFLIAANTFLSAWKSKSRRLV